MDTKFIFITGGVVSSLGKGITAASLGRLLKSRGLRVSIQKFDPYLNVDPGTMMRMSSRLISRDSTMRSARVAVAQCSAVRLLSTFACVLTWIGICGTCSYSASAAPRSLTIAASAPASAAACAV